MIVWLRVAGRGVIFAAGIALGVVISQVAAMFPVHEAYVSGLRAEQERAVMEGVAVYTGDGIRYLVPVSGRDKHEED